MTDLVVFAGAPRKGDRLCKQPGFGSQRYWVEPQILKTSTLSLLRGKGDRLIYLNPHPESVDPNSTLNPKP